jgi:hypothetical protein
MGDEGAYTVPRIMENVQAVKKQVIHAKIRNQSGNSIKNPVFLLPGNCLVR